jgi:ABC-2 type transport system permease protein
MIFTIAAKELRALFNAPLAWVVLAVLQVILAWIFLVSLDRYIGLQPQLIQYPNPPGVTEFVVAPLFGSGAVVLLMLVPLLSMRLIAEERRNQTLTLLMSAPVSMTEIVIGKFLGLALFLFAVVTLMGVMALSLLAGGKLDLGLLAANVIGLTLLGGAFAAIGLYISALTANPVIAAVATLASLLVLWIVNMGAPDPGSPLHLISLMKHYESFAKGVIDTDDLIYYLLLIALFLMLAARRLDRDRLAS